MGAGLRMPAALAMLQCIGYRARNHTANGGPMQAENKRVQTGELRAVLLSFVYFFCVLAAYYVIRPVREQLAAAVGSTQLPWFYMATLVATLLLTPLFAWMAARWPRRIVVPAVYVFFALCLLGFVPLFSGYGGLGPRALGIVFFVWVSVFNLFVVSVFWSFMADIWSNEQARRLFPLIGLGGTAGAVAGPLLTRGLVGVIGVAPLLVVSAALLGVALVCVIVLGHWARVHGARRHDAGHEAAVGGGMFDGLKQILSNPFMRGMALLMLLGDCIGTAGYALMTDYSGATFHNAVERTEFAANIDMLANVLQVAVQITLTRWLLMKKGAGAVIALWALISVGTLVATAVAPDPYALAVWIVPWVVLPVVITRSLTYGMVGPARESLYTRVPRQLRYQGKNAVDTAVWRAGDVAVSSGMIGLRGLGMGVPGFAALAALAATLSGVIGWRLARAVESAAPAAAETAPTR